MPGALHLAFYRGAGRFDDRIIRTATASAFSHVELVRGFGTAHCLSISASGRDGGVRTKDITFHPDRWEVVSLLGWVPDNAWGRAAAHIGAAYDYRGIFMSHALPLRRHNPSRWFCSELCAHALGIRNPHRLAPGDLMDVVLDLNQAFERGRQTV